MDAPVALLNHAAWQMMQPFRSRLIGELNSLDNPKAGPEDPAEDASISVRAAS
jgi:hypothetical protein